MGADVSILIPAYAAEAFIDQTLLFARGQTYPHIRILVSVDQCDDATADIVRRHAADDPRVSVVVQQERLGWVGNVNFLMDQVTTPYFFVYFHDDIILPQYVERLRDALIAAPHAAMAHCSVRYFGGAGHITAARQNIGAAERRLMQFLLAPERGAPLRGLTRTDMIGAIRLQRDLPGGWWANEVFLLQLAGAGENVAVPDVLYLHWAARPGGLTAGWRALEASAMFEGLRRIAAEALDYVMAGAGSEGERNSYAFAVYLWLNRLIADAESRTEGRLFAAPSELHPAFDVPQWPARLSAFDVEVQAWAEQRWPAVAADLAQRGAR